MDLTYCIEYEGKAIRCLVCKMKSFHPVDVELLFCGKCHRFHDMPDPVGLHEDQYRLLAMIRDASGPPVGLTHNPHQMILALYHRGLLLDEGGMVSITDRGHQTMGAYETEV